MYVHESFQFIMVFRSNIIFFQSGRQGEVFLWKLEKIDTEDKDYYTVMTYGKDRMKIQDDK